MRAAALLAAALVLGAGASEAQLPERGFFLVAKPTILDPNFTRTVVLVAHAPDGGTVGVILNRPTQQSLADVLPGNAQLARFTEPLHFGGEGAAPVTCQTVVAPAHVDVARPVDFLVMKDGSLLVSDDFAGAIYRITYSQ